MAHLLSFPFRIGANGAAVTRQEDTSDYYRELLAQMIATHPGERPMVPEYGLNDPTYAELDAQELVSKVNIFGPPVNIISIQTEYTGPSTQTVKVEFVPLDTDADSTDNTI